MEQVLPKDADTKITVSWAAIFKVLAACLLVYLAINLSRFVGLLLLSALIAIAFRPLVQWTRRHHWPKWSAVTLCGLILLGTVGLFFGVLAPTISSQAGGLVKNFPQLRESVLDRLSAWEPARNAVERLFNSQDFNAVLGGLQKFLAATGMVLNGLFEFFLVLIIAIYFVADGERLYQWCIAFLPEKDRREMATASDEVTDVASHYIVGQFITSALCATFAFLVLSFFHVPNAALLAVIAGLFDVLPLIGFFLFTIPAVAVAFTVSPATAGWVAVLYGAYHLFENYFIVPKVYGNRLRLSTLTVLISTLAAALVAGVLGVIIVLPLVACYPVIERHWLRHYLQPDTVQKHEELDARHHEDRRSHRGFFRRHATA